MGVEFYVTRADHWADNEGKEITVEEWLAYVASDPELKLDPRYGTHLAYWLGKSKYDEPWLAWLQGNINTKWPDTALYRKMLKIASALGARVQDHNGIVYMKYSDWCFEPIV
jgi:hypothetical protein